MNDEYIAVVGLGYAGLGLAIELAKIFPKTIGYDISRDRVNLLNDGIDINGVFSFKELKDSNIRITNNLFDIESANFYIIIVPTRINSKGDPDFQELILASKHIGNFLCKGDVVVYESTVYPGITEDICGQILSEVSGLKLGVDFKLAYSPERINPGDQENKLRNIVKVVSAIDSETLDRVSRVYEKITDAGIYCASSIKVAEAAKLVENIQRDINIGLMNDLALIFNRLEIRTDDILKTASTKWNFLPFKPGLVGGYCIEIAPYYMNAKAKELNYNSKILLAGREVNNQIGFYIAHRVIKFLSTYKDVSIKKSRVGILGITFKENIKDVRNSKVIDIIHELQQFAIEPLIHDPMADVNEVKRHHDISLLKWEEILNLDALIIAVPHKYYLQLPILELLTCLNHGGLLVDIKSVFDPKIIPEYINYWSL